MEGKMSVFDQRGQKVVYQYNVAGNISLDAVQNCLDFVRELDKIKAEVSKAGEAEVIQPETVTDVQYQVQKAIDQARKPEPDKKAIVEHLDRAKNFMKDVVQLAGFVSAIGKAIELAQNIF
jgi:ribosomal protein S18